MKADVVKEAYDNKGNDVIDSESQSPDSKKTVTTNMQILEPNDKMTSPISTVGRVGFLPDEVNEMKMVTLQSRKMRQMSVFLIFFVIISLVMTGLFIWRTVFFDQLYPNEKCKDKTCLTSESKKPQPPQPCRHRAKPKPFHKLPKKIEDELKFIQESMANKTIFSLANVVYMDKEIWSSFHGHPKYNHGRKLDEHTLFPVASITKVFTSIMTFKMYNNRTIDTLDDRFVKYEPNFKIKKRFKSKRHIVIRDILSHMSGLPREAPCYPDTDVNICPYNNTEMLRRINDMYLVMKPGLKPSYSNLGFGLLGQSLPKALYNLTYEEWMEEHLFKPLGLDDSTFDLAQTSNRSKIITGKNPKNENVQPKTWGWLNPTGGLFTSTSDLAKLWISLFRSLDEEAYLSPVFANELFAPAYVFPSTKSLVGVPFEMILSDGYLIRKKNGFIHGYASNVYLIPELKLAFSIMMPEPALYTDLLFKRLLKAFHEVLGGNSTKISLPRNPQAYVGTYVPVYENTTAPGLSKVEVEQQNDRLIFTALIYNQRAAFSINYLGNNTFEIWDRDDSDCLRVFVRGFDMERVYFGAISNETNYLAPGLQIYGVDPRGWTHFIRVK